MPAIQQAIENNIASKRDENKRAAQDAYETVEV